MPRSRALLSAALVALCGSAPLANAHEYWLVPSRYRAGAEDTVAIEARVGTGFRGEPRPFADRRADRRAAALRLRGPREVDLLPAAADGAPLFARFRPADGRGVVVAYESNFATISIPGSEFDDYLKTEGLERALRLRRERGDTAAGRERYARCAKTWIGGAETQRLARPMGLTLELVPLRDPNGEGPLRVRALFRSRPLDGLLVRAWRQPPAADPHAAARDSTGAVAEGRTGRDGVATLALPGPGEYLLSGVHMLPADEAERARGAEGARGALGARERDRAGEIPPADWESYWTSLTFERR
jgi:hypothetical protein